MTAHRLTKLEIEHFRSINDPVTVRLDAPVVLIHGPNGAGKTSLLSAIELALTGSVPSLERADPTYGSQLLHYGSERGRVALEYTTAAGAASAEVELGRSSFERRGGLSKPLAQFFSERCFLAQSLLSQLLTIYQQSGSDLESPLSRFVNELLGLDRLDALERGLRPSLDLRNTRKIAPSYIAVERERDRLRDQISRLQTADQAAREVQVTAIAGLDRTLVQLASLGLRLTADQSDLVSALAPGEEVAEIRRYSDASQRGGAAGRTWTRLASIRASSPREALDARLRATEVALEAWRADAGAAIASLFIRASELGLATPASPGTDIGKDLQEQRSQWERELERLREQLEKDQASVQRARVIEDEQTALTARALNLARQLTSASVDADGLSRALAAILPHVHEPNCPVCGRDYSEVSDHTLADDLSGKIAELGDVAERLVQVSRDQAATTRRQAELSRELEGLKSRLIPDEERLNLQDRLAKIEAVSADGAQLQIHAELGGRLLAENTDARRSVELWSSLDSEERALRDDLTLLAADVGLTVDWTSQGFSESIADIEARSADMLERSRSLQNLKLVATRQLAERAASRAAAELAATELNVSNQMFERVTSALAAAEALRARTRLIVQSVAQARSDVVGRVFNDRLNRVWRDLFVRLAPSEAFVPSFFLPTSDDAKEGRPILRTLHRSGDQGGAPGAMLSAGNLNTAALTLFLALHLSVEPKLPWLLLDDPVQSMDEVHISQFAALLRTLSKEHGRQVFIAVHDRPLFDYLSLELSPAFNGDELITIEISASTSGRTRIAPNRLGYKEDLAIVHAA